MAATEWTAWRLAFQSQLGAPFFRLGHWPIYQAAAFFVWWFKFDAYAPVIFFEGGAIAASGGIVAIALAMMLTVFRADEARDVTTYGLARWVDAREVRRRVSWGLMASSSAGLSATIYGMTDPSMCSVLPRRVPARASASWS